jgi:hypothetical protein
MDFSDLNLWQLAGQVWVIMSSLCSVMAARSSNHLDDVKNFSPWLPTHPNPWFIREVSVTHATWCCVALMLIPTMASSSTGSSSTSYCAIDPALGVDLRVGCMWPAYYCILLHRHHQHDYIVDSIKIGGEYVRSMCMWRAAWQNWCTKLIWQVADVIEVPDGGSLIGDNGDDKVVGMPGDNLDTIAPRPDCGRPGQRATGLMASWDIHLPISSCASPTSSAFRARHGFVHNDGYNDFNSTTSTSTR